MTRSRILTVQGELAAEAAKLGLRVFSYSPGDGARRYRFALASDCKAGDDWFSVDPVLASLVGARNAHHWLAGYAAARRVLPHQVRP